MGEAIIEKYFPDLTDRQKEQFSQLGPLYGEWNEKINVISRKDIDNLYEKHVLHSMGIAKVAKFVDGTRILDIGTGGGFPGIPLAILFPEVHFTLVDSIGKKITVVKEVATALGLKNLEAHHARGEKIKGKFDYIISRAVTSLDKFLPWTNGKIDRKQRNHLPNGILYLKGGNLKAELKPVKRYYEVYDLSDYFKESFFETKKVVYIKMV